MIPTMCSGGEEDVLTFTLATDGGKKFLMFWKAKRNQKPMREKTKLTIPYIYFREAFESTDFFYKKKFT